jgi:hypothetical protein
VSPVLYFVDTNFRFNATGELFEVNFNQKCCQFKNREAHLIVYEMYQADFYSEFYLSSFFVQVVSSACLPPFKNHILTYLLGFNLERGLLLI